MRSSFQHLFCHTSALQHASNLSFPDRSFSSQTASFLREHHRRAILSSNLSSNLMTAQAADTAGAEESIQAAAAAAAEAAASVVVDATESLPCQA